MSVAKFALLASLVSFLVAGTFGMANAGMSMSTDGHMSGCPLMGVPALCHMSPLEHAFTLQNMLTAIPFSGIFTLLISILLAFSIAFLAPLVWLNLAVLFEPIVRPPSSRDRLISRHALQEAFSNGILNSKAF